MDYDDDDYGTQHYGHRNTQASLLGARPKNYMASPAQMYSGWRHNGGNTGGHQGVSSILRGGNRGQRGGGQGRGQGGAGRGRGQRGGSQGRGGRGGGAAAATANGGQGRGNKWQHGGRGSNRGGNQGQRGSASANVANNSTRLGSVDNLFSYGGGINSSGGGGAMGSLMDLSTESFHGTPNRGRGASRGRGRAFKHQNDGSRPRQAGRWNGDNGTNGDFAKEHNRRLNPTGFNTLVEWSTKPPDVVIHCLLDKWSGIPELLAEDKIPDDKMVLLIKILSIASTCLSCRQSLIEVFILVFTGDFVGKLVRFQMSLINSKRTDLPIFLRDQLQLLKAYRRVHPSQARELLPELVQSVELVLPKIMQRHFGLEEVQSEYEKLLQTLTEEQSKTEIIRSKKIPLADRLVQLDDYEPEDDYRDLTIEPSPEDFSTFEAPIIRRNITHGAYKDVYNYLDVQFRLLREDFIRPLREGVYQVRHGERATKDVRLYRRVTFQETKVVYGELVHFVKLNLPKTFKVESSKRLLFGNVMCFSADDFATYFLATIAAKDVNMLKQGLVGVKLLSQPKLNPNLQYTAVESRAFFTSYKHVLKALQLMDGSTLPLAEHIVFAQRDIEPPEYLINSRMRNFDLRVVLNCTYMKAAKPNKMFPNVKTVQPPAGWRGDLEAIPVLHARVADWPGAADFGLDNSQLAALHAALTKRLVIIQGPPGTGKTFLGLKITQVLLHNSDAWARKEMEIQEIKAKRVVKQLKAVEVDVTSPILVLCYTNHALDQFLEGMLKYTNKVIRIGSRSKSEEIQRYQINEYLSSLKQQRLFPAHIHHAKSKIRGQIVEAEGDLKRQFYQLDEVSKNLGLVSWELLMSYNVIPTAIARQLMGREGYRSWMLPMNQQNCFTDFAYDVREVWSPLKKMNISDAKEDEQAAADKSKDDDEWHDALEILREAENDRLIDMDDDLFSEADVYNARSGKIYEVTQMDQQQMWQALEFDFKEGNLTQEDVDVQWRTFQFEQNCLAEILRYSEKNVAPASSFTIREDVPVFNLAFKDRCLLYAIWRHRLLHKMRESIRPHENKLQTLLSKNQEVKNSEYLHVARQADVVGLTTTGAAQFQAVVQELRPRIVIIEEAAEILEAHVVASLNAGCEHLIMIGDHQQLKPSPAVYQLAKHYGLDTSLFERMINNGVAYQTLEYQHRMRPEISSLLVPSIYEHLKDHQSVHGRPHIRGVHKSVFFISHKEKELGESDDNNSHSNVHEATFIMRLARHLVLQGYSTEQITVLTPYSGQFFLLRKEQRKYGPTCEGMRISIVDNFQGEENDIILLSLVRSNDDGNVGFLKIENRVCVALSRAKLGFFIIGNMDQLRQKSDLWVKISESLETNDSLGDALVLCCSNHPDEKAAVKTEDDIRLKSPEGGCTRPCSVTFPLCGHPCPRVCHPDDPAHIEGKCREPCAQKCAKRGHPCPAYCFQECPPCLVPVEKQLPCEHAHLVPCHVSREKFKCPSKVEKVIEACGHTVEMACHVDPKKKKCPVKCDVRLDCGHSCDQLCHVKDDPEHLKYLCQATCSRKMKGCTEDHKCTLLCYQSCTDCVIKVEKKLPCGHKAQIPCQDPVEGFTCRQNCRKSLECGHHCPRRCWEPCGGCVVKVVKKSTDCEHGIVTECSKTPGREMCLSKSCSRRLPCGHKCPRSCCEPCGGCQEVVSSGVVCQAGGHELLVPCSSLPMAQPDFSLCRVPCQAKLQCEHPCKGTCGACFHGRFHLPCAQKCDRVLVCGHVCKSPCSAACPPCQDKCRWKCSHSRCHKNCGVECIPCQEPCSYKCDHQEVSCTKKCGEECDCEPCEEPCLKLLKCGHPCVGLCGDPCPPLCRICDVEKLTEFELLGIEGEPDARFVLMEDCGHVIECEGLSHWLMQQNSRQVQMKRCPMCQEPIYNNRRFKNLVLQTYKDVQKVLFKHADQKLPTLGDIVLRCTSLEPDSADEDVPKLNESLAFLTCIEKSILCKTVKDYITAQVATANAKKNKGKPRKKELKFGAEKLHLFNFQVDVILMAKKIYEELDEKLKKDLELVMTRVMAQNVSVVRQFMEEVECELQRLRYMSQMKSVRTHSYNPRVLACVEQIDIIMNPTKVFTASSEAQVKLLLKKCQSYAGGLGISDEERCSIVKAMTDVRKGAWYKCPNGHIYCITECGGAMVTSNCPDCDSKIGGSSHQLLGNNSLASEMDGASTYAWPQ